MSEQPTALVFRHGMCEYNRDGKLNGQHDPDLAPEGITQAGELAKTLNAHVSSGQIAPPVAVYTSDLRRASSTAGIVTDHLEIPRGLAFPALRERCLGEVEGMTYAQALAYVADKHKIPTPHGVTYCQDSRYGFETFDEATVRAAQFFRYVVLTHGIAEGAGTVWVFTHGDFALALAAAWTSRPMEEIIQEAYLKNTQAMELYPDKSYKIADFTLAS